MTDSKVESTPIKDIITKRDGEPDRAKYHSKRIKRLLEDLAPDEASRVLGEEFAELEEEREIDPLTGIKTRLSGIREIERQIEISKETGKKLSLVMFDLDGFKFINDTQGHEKGNEAIKIMAEFLDKRTSAECMACRYGGDEFFLIMSGSTKEAALGLANRIVEELPALMQEKGFNVTSSAGIAALESTDTSPEKFLNRADQALLKAKKTGKNRVEE